jgi:ABC-type lipoprotein export system ATPase subunit
MIVCDRLVRIYSGKGIEVQALQGLDLLIAEGELTALIGAAGSGKSTLVNILAGLDTPTAGTVWVAGHNLGAMTARDRLTYRRSVAGFIWQQTSRNLLPYMTAPAERAPADAAKPARPPGAAAARQFPARHPRHHALRRPDSGPHVRR